VQRGREIKNYMETVVALERELFLNGFYRAYSMLAGPCILCKECAFLNNLPCTFPDKARPSMEASGIDVYQSAHNHGLPLSPLRSEDETRNIYCLLLVD
jgi:predicted metal-binding protein